jgi:hypothetical protein
VVKNAHYNMEFFEQGRPVTKNLLRNAMNESCATGMSATARQASAAGIGSWSRTGCRTA